MYATAAEGSLPKLATSYEQNREELAWDEIPRLVKDAAVAGEDPRFFEHGRVDAQGTLRAAVQLVLGQGGSGGSSTGSQGRAKRVVPHVPGPPSLRAAGLPRWAVGEVVEQLDELAADTSAGKLGEDIL
jgi:hypothetical protein